jgi:hypothetical protein
MKKIIVVGSVLAWAGIASAVLLMEQDFNDSKGAVSWVDRANNEIKWGGGFQKTSSEAAPVNGGGCSGVMSGTGAFKTQSLFDKNLQSLTVGGWVKLTLGEEKIGNSAVFSARGPNKKGFAVAVSNNGKQLYVLLDEQVINVDFKWPVDTWMFIAMSYDVTTSESGGMKLYVGSTTEALTLVAESKVSVDHVTVQGQRLGLGYKNISGLIDNVRLYGSPVDGSGALTAEEIKVWMQSSDLNESKQEGLKIFHTVGAIQLFNAGFLR